MNAIILTIYLLFMPLVQAPPAPYIEAGEVRVILNDCEWGARGDTCNLQAPVMVDAFTLYREERQHYYTMSGMYYYDLEELLMIRYKLSVYEPGQLYLICNDMMTTYRKNGEILPAKEEQ
jgi:hypothetical protein